MLGKYQKKSVSPKKPKLKSVKKSVKPKLKSVKPKVKSEKKSEKPKVKSVKKSEKPKVKSVKKSEKPEVKPKVETVSKSDSGCVEQFTKKYQERPSPAYPANKCCGESKRGKDGLMYESRADKNGVCTWKKVKNHSGVRKKRPDPFNPEQLISKYNQEISEIVNKLVVNPQNIYLQHRLAFLRKEVTRLLDKIDDMPPEPLRLERH